MKKILLIEDDTFISEMVVKKLKEAGLAVSLAIDAETGMAKVQEDKPDLILLDIVLPGMDGYEFLEKIKADKKLSSLPVLILSNLGQKDEIERGLALGAKDFLVKAAFDPREVLEKVTAFLGATPKQAIAIQAHDAQQVATSKSTNPNGSHVLVIEDDKFLRELLLEKLLSRGIRVIGAVDGKEAFTSLESSKPALIVLDIILPDINGFEILAKIRADKNTHAIPVLILSNLYQKEDMDRAGTLGISGSMIKSNFSLGEIATKIESILAEKSQ